MNPRIKTLLFAALFAIAVPGGATPSQAADFIVYSINRQLDMGNPGEAPRKDFYVNMGTTNGLRDGAVVDVYRKIPTYNTITEKLYREISYKVATLKIIHTEANVAVGRLDKLTPAEKMPIAPVQGVMIGDLIHPANAANE